MICSELYRADNGLCAGGDRRANEWRTDGRTDGDVTWLAAAATQSQVQTISIRARSANCLWSAAPATGHALRRHSWSIVARKQTADSGPRKHNMILLWYITIRWISSALEQSAWEIFSWVAIWVYKSISIQKHINFRLITVNELINFKRILFPLMTAVSQKINIWTK